MRALRRTPPAFVALALLVAASAIASPEQDAAAPCAPCHGASGRSAVSTFPNLAGQQTQYLQKQLVDFAKGRRTNEAMTAALARVPRSDFPELVAHYGAQTPASGHAGDAALAAAGRKIFEDGDWPADIPPCRSCHGERGAGAGRYPRLAGQNPAYTLQQLTAFKSGARHNDTRRAMREIAARLTETQMKALAEYLADL